jgi:hypothetical protein
MTTHDHGYSDLPTTQDELGVAPSATALTQIVQGTAIQDTPLTVGIYGPWGSGKTSLMQMILSGLDEHHCIPVWFDAWRYAQSDTLWRALLLAVVEELRLFVERDDAWLRDAIGYQNRRDLSGKQIGTDDAALQAERATRTARLDELVDRLYRSAIGMENAEWRMQNEAHANKPDTAPLTRRCSLSIVHYPLSILSGDCCRADCQAGGHPEQLRRPLRVYQRHPDRPARQ